MSAAQLSASHSRCAPPGDAVGVSTAMLQGARMSDSGSAEQRSRPAAASSSARARYEPKRSTAPGSRSC